MSYPELLIDRRKLMHNVKTLLTMAQGCDIQLHFVTKCLCAWRPAVEAMEEAGAEFFADSRLENLANIQDLGQSHMLVRIPMISQAMDTVRYSDLSLNSDISAIEALSDAALALERQHGVILMVEMGDLREGFLAEEIMDVAARTLNLRGVWLAGIGVNFNCYGGVIPEEKQLNQLVELAENIRQRFDIPLPIVSGGNTGSLYMIKEGKMPRGISHLRLGEGYLIGIETSFRRPIPDMYTDVFTLRAEIIELRKKASVPQGLIGPNAFNEIPEFEDYGNIWRAILAVGEQDTRSDTLEPRDSKVRFLGSSSDHLLLDVTQSVRDFKVGDVMDFTPDYAALLRAMTSPYVTKRMV